MRNTGISYACSRALISTYHVQNGNIYIKQILLDLEKKPEMDGSAELLTSEIQTDQSSNVMIKCLFIFFKYQMFLHIHFVDKQSPNIKKKNQNQKRIKCVFGQNHIPFSAATATPPASLLGGLLQWSAQKSK